MAERAKADVFFEASSLEAQTGQPALDHLKAALHGGAHAISANKGRWYMDIESFHTG